VERAEGETELSC